MSKPNKDKDMIVEGYGGCEIRIGSRVRHAAGGLESTVQAVDEHGDGGITLVCEGSGGYMRILAKQAVLATEEADSKHWTDRYSRS